MFSISHWKININPIHPKIQADVTQQKLPGWWHNSLTFPSPAEWLILQTGSHYRSQLNTLPLTSASCRALRSGCWRGSVWSAGSFESAWAQGWGWSQPEGTPWGSALRPVAAACRRRWDEQERRAGPQACKYRPQWCQRLFTYIFLASTLFTELVISRRALK